MIKKIFLFFLLVIVSLSILGAQNFEGIIIYERTTTEGKVALKTYYFGDQKIRIDSRFYFDTYFDDGVSIFDFKNYTNKYFSNSGDNMPFRPIEIKRNTISQMDIFPDSLKTILDFECYLVEAELDVGVYSAIMNQKRYHAKDLKFKVSDEWLLDYISVISGDNNIALYWEAGLETLDPELMIAFDPHRRFSYRAIKVIPMKLPDSLFDYEVLLSEGK